MRVISSLAVFCVPGFENAANKPAAVFSGRQVMP